MKQTDKGRIETILPVGFELCVWQSEVGRPWEVALHRYGVNAVIEAKTGAYFMSKSMKVHAMAGNHKDYDAAITQCDIPMEIRETLGRHFETDADARVVKDQLVAKYGRYFNIKNMPEKLDVSRIQQYTQTARYI